MLGVDEAQRGVIYYSGLLAWVGCHTDAYEQAKWFGDDTTLKRDAHYGGDLGRTGPAMAFLLGHVGGAERPLVRRARTRLAFVSGGLQAMRALAENHDRATAVSRRRRHPPRSRQPRSPAAMLTRLSRLRV